MSFLERDKCPFIRIVSTVLSAGHRYLESLSLYTVHPFSTLNFLGRPVKPLFYGHGRSSIPTAVNMDSILCLPEVILEKSWHYLPGFLPEY